MDKIYRDICPSEKCTGCMACVSTCHHEAIHITTTPLGFKYPKIDSAKCINCGLCISTCPGNNPPAKRFPSNCYAFALRDEEQLHNVASGGIATYLSQLIIERGGVVYGCSGEDMTHVRHIRIDSKVDIDKLLGSKYVQSDMIDIATSVLSDLKAGIRVLFIGTPCQVAGILKFVRKDWANLITVDLVCHGVPSQKLLNDNIALYKARHSDIDINSVCFRRKTNQNQSEKIDYGWFYRTNHNQKSNFVKWYYDPYMLGFLSCTTFRECCYQCEYAYNIRVSDITISDFWGLSNEAGFINGKGVSSILVNTEKGIKLMDDIIQSADDFIIRKRTVQESISGNGQLMCPSHKPPYAESFRRYYPIHGWEKSIQMSLRKFKLFTQIKLIVKSIFNLIFK